MTMRKILYLFFILFSTTFFAQTTLTFTNMTCNTTTFTITNPAISNGVHNVGYTIGCTMFDVDNYLVLLGYISVPATFSGGSATITINDPAKYHRIIKLHYLDAPIPEASKPTISFFRDGEPFLNDPGQIRKIGTPANVICKGNPFELGISDSTVYTTPFTSCLSSVGCGAFCYPTIEVTIQMTGANVGTFTDLMDGALFDNIDVPPGLLVNNGTTTFHLIGLREMGARRLSTNGMDCSPDYTSFPLGKYILTIDVVDGINLVGPNNVIVTDPVCVGTNTTATFSSSTLANGNYDIQYFFWDGTNPATAVLNTVTNVPFNSGTATFPITTNASSIGSYVFDILNIADSSSGCNQSFNSGEVRDNFIISSPPNINWNKFCSGLRCLFRK